MSEKPVMPVVVVGAGPVGLTAALALARQGIAPIMLEAKPALAYSSRAICISRRSLEIYDRLGVGPRFMAKGLGWHRGWTFWRDKLVFELAMPHGSDNRHPPFINLQQCHTEQFLCDAAAASGVDIRWGARVTALRESADAVVLTVDEDGRRYELAARYVVAADGARSTLRERLGLSFAGTSYEGRYLIADIEIAAARPVERRVWFDSPSNPGSTVILHIQPDNIWRVDFQLLDDEDPEAALEEPRVLARIRRHLDMIGERAPWKLVWRSLYRAHCLTLDAYRHGRVLFAGDAAHLVPIFGVRGLNSGIDDAHNLGWKLAMVLRGEAPDALLDSYSRERVPATHENIAQATKSTWFMSPPTRGFRLMRDAVLTLAVTHPFVRPLINPRQASPYAYGDSPLTTRDEEAGGVPPGSPLPNAPIAWIAAGRCARRHLHAAFSPRGYTLLIFADAAGATPIEAVQAWARRQSPAVGVVLVHSPETKAPSDPFIADDDGRLAALLDATRFRAYLIRPDEHVAARFRDLDPAPIAAALDRGCGRTASHDLAHGVTVTA